MPSHCKPIAIRTSVVPWNQIPRADQLRMERARRNLAAMVGQIIADAMEEANRK